jgi:inner membrane protein
VAGTRLAPVLAVLCIGVLDLIDAAGDWPLVIRGALDEPAHLLTAWLILNAVAPARGRMWGWALLGAVLIDLDHIPLVLWGGPVTEFGGRPVTHSLTTVAVLAVVALAVPRVRVAAGGLAVGVLLHLLRDLATGPGVPLLWPLRPENVLVPYWVYALLIVAAAVVPLAMSAPARGSPPTSA